MAYIMYVSNGLGYEHGNISRREASRLGDGYSDWNGRYCSCMDCGMYMTFDPSWNSWECPSCGQHVDVDTYDNMVSDLEFDES